MSVRFGMEGVDKVVCPLGRLGRFEKGVRRGLDRRGRMRSARTTARAEGSGGGKGEEEVGGVQVGG